MRVFSKWFDAAREKGLVIASTLNEKENELYVLTPDHKWIKYKIMQDKHPISTL